MANTKEYYIKINGLTESVSAVESLNKQLDALEKRMKALESSGAKVSTGGGGNSSAMSQEAAVQKEINKLKAEGERLDAKIAASQDEIYKRVDATKQLYKETIADQKAIAAQERLTADAYSNTMQGMKNHLADLKAAINVTDLGDSDKIKQMTQEANELTNKLKEMEEAYGTFGRNVGNYGSAVDGLSKYKIEVGGVVREFNTAKEAAKTLSNELLNLPKGAKGAKELREALQQVKSEIQDIGKSSAVMDNLLDTMEGIVAVANVGQGIRGLFGVNDAEIQKSIKNLVALQNVLKGIESINKQINTREGIGAWIAPFTTGVDKATARLLVFNRALFGTGKASKVAAVGIKLFSKALKVAFSAGILIAVDLLVEKLMDLVESFKKVDDAADDAKEAQKDISKAYAEGSATLLKYQTIAKSFNGTKEQEKKLVDELNSELGSSLGTYKSLAEWMDVLTKKGDDYIKMLVLQAKAQAAFNNLVKAREKEQEVKEMSNEDYETFFDKFLPSSWTEGRRNNARVAAIQAATAYTASAEEAFAQSQKEVEEFMKNHGVGNYAPQIEKNGKKTKKAVDEVQRTLTDLEMRLMKEGLNKKLKQLNEEERQTINKLQENGRKTSEVIKQIQRKYAALRAKEIEEYLKNIEESLKKSAQEIEKIQFDINTKTIEQNITSLEKKVETWKTKFEDINFNPLTSNADLKKQAEEERKIYKEKVNQLRDSFESRYEITKRFIGKTIDDETAFMQDEKAINEERINEQLKQDKEAEKERQRVLMSGLTENEETIKEAIEAIKKQYGQFRESGIAQGAFYIDDEKQKDNYGALLVELAEVQEKIKTARQQHKDRMEQIEKDANDAIEKNEVDSLKKISEAQERYFGQQVTNYRDLVSKINNELNKSPIYNKDTGIVDKEATRKQYLELINAAEFAFKTIEQDKKELDRKFADGIITEEVKHTTEKNLDELKQAIEEGYNEILDKNVNVTSDYLKSLEMYLQAAAEIVSTIMGGIFEAINNGFDREQEELDREYEQMQDELDKRRDAIKDYTDEINNIEDELSTARGSRRQHLIDQLNAEMELQREAAKERQRLDKEEQKNKEQMQKKQDALDKKRRKAQWYQDLAQAVVNGAMAVTYAAMNTWPVPAIPMMQLAAATSAVQLGVIAANHPFEKGGQLEGGVAQGPRHRDGGIPVLGGRASIEGGEFITNRQTTAKNVDLLDYINSKHKKLNLDDFIDFYSSGKVKKSISSMSPRLKFADGGVIPSLRTDIDINDRLMTAFEDYSDRPVVVSVQDINSRQAAVRNVQVLAGLNPE